MNKIDSVSHWVKSSRLRGVMLCLAAVCSLMLGVEPVGGQVAPAESAVGRGEGGTYQQLLTPLTSSAGVHLAGWQVTDLGAATVTELSPRLGSTALRLSANSNRSGGKVDVGVQGAVAGEMRAIGLWIHLDDGSNVSRVGLQIIDAEGEAFLLQREANWTGWQWIEFDLANDTWPQAYKQADKNSRIDQPVRNVNVAWFTEQAGPTHVVVNALVATVTEASPQRVQLVLPTVIEPDQPADLQLAIHHPGDQPATYTVEYELHRDSQLLPLTLPDPIHGSDHAAGAVNWVELDGEEVDRGSLTDSPAGTSYRTPWGSGYKEIVQYLDLGESRTITHLAFDSGDANWVWKVDVAASPDGRTWTDVHGLAGIDVHKKWGRQTIPVQAPFDARHLRLRYHNDGAEVNTLNTFTRLSVYDGVADESWPLPQADGLLASGEATVSVTPRGLAVVATGDQQALTTGAYLLSVRVNGDGWTQVLADRIFVMPQPVTAEQQARARIGLNSSNLNYAEMHRRLGIGWVRFENMKWQMSSPAPGKFVYEGIPPWNVHQDRYVRTMADQNIQTLPYLFLSPAWASSAPADAKHRAAYPPTDYNDYAEYVFQTAARYGSQKHDPSVLKTDDKLSGLGLISIFELWNEPNLNDPNWGHWVGPLNEYFEMFRLGAEAAKRADPKALVANAGFAGITLELVDQLRTYKYADGKSPLDFIDVISVHTYTGENPPELSFVDTNRNRSRNPELGIAHEEHMRRLTAWRDMHKPGTPIWMTETGYDSAGPRGVPERQQAAYNIRNTLMMLANGIDMVLVYRETGSANSLYAASGLMRGDLTLKPSWFAFATLLRQLDQAESIQRLPHPNPEVYLVGWQRDGAWNLAAWSIADGQHALELSLGSAHVTDSFGAVTQMDDSAGLVLGEMPLYLGQIGRPEAVEQLVEQGAADHARWLAERRRLSEAKAILLDFGGDEHIGAIDLGGPRQMTTVGHDKLYDDGDGYGFETAALNNVDAHWIRDAAARDGVRLDGSHRFLVDIQPGKYHMTLHAASISETPQTVTVQTGSGEPLTLPAIRNDPPSEATFETTASQIIFEFSGHIDLRSLVLVRIDD